MVDLYGNKLITLLMIIITIMIISIIIILIIIIIVMGIIEFRSGHSTTWLFLSPIWWGKKPEDRSISLEQGENQQKTQPGYM